MCVCHEVKTFVVVLANYGRMLVTKFAPHFDLWENVPSPPTSLCCNDPCQSSVTFAIKRRFLNACAIYSLAGKFHTPPCLAINTLNDEWKWFRRTSFVKRRPHSFRDNHVFRIIFETINHLCWGLLDRVFVGLFHVSHEMSKLKLLNYRRYWNISLLLMINRK